MTRWLDEPSASDADVPESPHPRLPGVWSGIGTVVLYFALQFGMALAMGALVGVAIAIGYAVSAGIHHVKVDPAVIQHLTQSADARVVSIVLTLATAAAVMLLFIHRCWGSLWTVSRPPGLGFTRPANSWYFPLAIITGLAAVFLGGLLAHALAGDHAPKQDINLWARSVSMGLRVPLALVTVCIAPLVEELIFRGVLLSGLMRRMHVGWAALLTALIFGCVHLPDFDFAWYPVSTLVLFGLLLAWLRLKSRSLWPAVAAHATNNLVAVIGWFVIVHPHP